MGLGSWSRFRGRRGRSLRHRSGSKWRSYRLGMDGYRRNMKMMKIHTFATHSQNSG